VLASGQLVSRTQRYALTETEWAVEMSRRRRSSRLPDLGRRRRDMIRNFKKTPGRVLRPGVPLLTTCSKVGPVSCECVPGFSGFWLPSSEAMFAHSPSGRYQTRLRDRDGR